MDLMRRRVKDMSEELSQDIELLYDNSEALLRQATTFEGRDFYDKLKKFRRKERVRFSGLYWFFDSKGNVLYVGQSVNITQRVYAHLNGGQAPTNDLVNIIYGVSFIAPNKKHVKKHSLIDLEYRVIKTLQPLFNGSSKGVWDAYGFKNLREFLKNIHRDIDLDARTQLIKKEIEDFTSTGKIKHRKPSTVKSEGGDIVNDKINNSIKISSIKESIKLIVENVHDEEKADKLIEGLLLLLLKYD